VLAAKTGATIAPLAIRRTGDGRYRIEPHGEFTVPSSDPAAIQHATQRIADALQETIAAAPEQWYSFKPMWPDDPKESRELEARAAESAGGDAGTRTTTGRGHGAAAEVASP
jgi:lauroyl/myristoyl acyltransferase